MKKILILTEKPSVASDIARVFKVKKVEIFMMVINIR